VLERSRRGTELGGPQRQLGHEQFAIPLWLRPDDVAQGKDIVNAAVHWITTQTP
jgi:hypothetical protein